MIVTKTFIDHIHIQFAHGAEHQQAKVGQIEGAQFAEIEFLVDSETGDVVGRTENKLNGAVRPLDPDKVADVLGKQFSAIEGQVRDLRARLVAGEATAQEAAHGAAREIAKRDTEIVRINNELMSALAQLADIAARNKAAAAALSG